MVPAVIVCVCSIQFVSLYNILYRSIGSIGHWTFVMTSYVQPLHAILLSDVEN